MKTALWTAHQYMFSRKIKNKFRIFTVLLANQSELSLFLNRVSSFLSTKVNWIEILWKFEKINCPRKYVVRSSFIYIWYRIPLISMAISTFVRFILIHNFSPVGTSEQVVQGDQSLPRFWLLCKQNLRPQGIF